MARYTQQLLSAAIKELIKEKPLDEITVQELVDRANVNRKTFYYNFHSISDLLNWMYTEGFGAEVSAAQIAPDTWKQLFLDTMDYVRGEAVYLRAIYDSGYGPSFRLCMKRLFERAMARFVRSAVGVFETRCQVSLSLTPQQLQYVVQYYTMAFFGMLEAWFLGGMPDSNEEFVYMLSKLSQNNMYQTFASLEKEKRISADIPERAPKKQ
jgi:AcrR family transcriptional regulator